MRRQSRLRYGRRIRFPVPNLNDGVRRRLRERFGADVEPWFDELPRVLRSLAERWRLEFGSPIPRGSMSVVIRCRMADGRPAVVKVSPDRARLANEAAALDSWATVHSPSVYAFDADIGALLLEAIEPGIALVEALSYPKLESVAELLTSLHTTGVPESSYLALARRVAYLFESGARLYRRRPELVEIVPPGLYERGRQLAMRLAEEVSPTALLHGDLTPRNILDGGTKRGLVAIDPAPCLGADLAFDAIDLLLWRADDVDVIASRAEKLAPAINVNASRLLDWCSAFAGMTAVELAAAPDGSRKQIDTALILAAQAPTA